MGMVSATPEAGRGAAGLGPVLGTGSTRDRLWSLSRDAEVVKSLLVARVRTPTWWRRERGVDGRESQGQGCVGREDPSIPWLSFAPSASSSPTRLVPQSGWCHVLL